MTAEERKGIENGIWLCATCATLIDRDPDRHPAELLQDWKQQTEALATHQNGQPGGGLEGFDAEVENAVALFRDGKIEAGLDRLRQLRTRKWDRLSIRQRYRVIANQGVGFLTKGDQQRAAALFTEAAWYQPDDPDAQALLARATELSGESEEAYELAEDLVTTRACGRAAGTYIRCAPADKTAAMLASTTKLWHGNHEVLIALTVRAIDEQSFDLAEEFSASLSDNFPDSPDGPLLQGQVACCRQVSAMHPSSTQAARELDTDGLALAEQRLTRGYEIAIAKRIEKSAAAALIFRYELRILLGKDSDAKLDLEEASRLAPRHPDVLIARAFALPGEDHRPLALQLLRDAIEAGAGERAMMFLGCRLMEMESDHAEALCILTRVARARGPQSDEALGFAFDLASRLEEVEQTAELLSLATEFDGCLYATLQAQNALQSKDFTQARKFASQAHDVWRSGPAKASTRRRLADLLSRLDDDTGAREIWESLVIRGFPSQELWKLLATAYDQGDHQLILEHCAALRQKEHWIRQYVNLEASLLQEYDPEAAYQLLTEHLKQDTDDKVATLRRCTVCLRTGRETEAVVDVALLPDAEGNVAMALATARMLHATSQHDSCLAYSYRLLRAHWSESDAHFLFFRLHLETEPHLRPERPTIGGPGTAICFRELGRESERWW